jgi:hypothetical protein
VTRKKDSLILPRWAPLLVLLPLAIIFADSALNAAFGWHEPVTDVVSGVKEPRLEAMGRTRVLASIIPFALVASLITIHFVRDYLSLLGPRARRQLLAPILLWTGTAGIVIGLQNAGYGAPDEVIGSNFIDVAFGATRATGSGLTLVAVLDTLVAVFRILLTFGAGAAIMGTISCLAEPVRSLPVRTRRYYRQLQRGRLDGYLYASALLLVTGLFFIDSCMRWPSPFSTNPDLYMEHVNALMLASGIFYSSIIISYYVPAALWVRRFSAPGSGALGGAAAAPPGNEAMSPAGVIKAFLALMSPALAGLLTQVLEGLGS